MNYEHMYSQGRSQRSGHRGAEAERRTTTEVVRLAPGGGELEEARSGGYNTRFPIGEAWLNSTEHM